MAEETWDEQELSLGEKAQALMGALKPAYWQVRGCRCWVA